MFSFFPADLILKISNENSFVNQARLGQTCKRVNELFKSNSKRIVHSINHTHLVLYKIDSIFFSFCLMNRNESVLEYTLGYILANRFIADMKGDSLLLIKKLKSLDYSEMDKIAIFLENALEEEKQSALNKNLTSSRS